MARPTFTENQRKRLKDIGLLPAQITEIENTLASNRALLEQPAPMNDVREELGAFRDAMDRACKIAAKLSDPKKYSKDKVAARNEAWARLQWAASEASDVIEALSASQAALETLGAIINIAINSLPKQQRTSVAADFRPIARIDEALLRGFTKADKSPLPPYTLKVSSSSGNKFRQIVGICYAAMGQKNDDPERAIKTYLRVLKMRRAASHGNASSVR